ncbi:MAG: hypothetical protein ACJA0H_001564 [Francisellaceae bacterium]|jgi:hypothetical protein
MSLRENGNARTHASSAHGEGRKLYNLKPRHAKLAIHSAHTLALFVLETWDKKYIEVCTDVHCRIGSLETILLHHPRELNVHCRIGSLEKVG